MCSASPCSATTPPAVATPAAACSAGHDSIWRSASTAGDTSRVERRLIPGHSPYESVVGLLAGGRRRADVHVAGTAPIPREGDPPEGAYEQARLCLELVGEALGAGGRRRSRTSSARGCSSSDPEDWQEIARAHGEVFAEIRPAVDGVVVTGLLDPRWRVEIEAEAVLPA